MSTSKKTSLGRKKKSMTSVQFSQNFYHLHYRCAPCSLVMDRSSLLCIPYLNVELDVQLREEQQGKGQKWSYK